jgi:putative DNA primase/helicase
MDVGGDLPGARPAEEHAVNVSAIPLELRDRPQWVVWRLEKRDGKATKVPYVARPPLNRGAATGTQKRWRASTTDPSTWRTCLEAFETAKDDCWDGIGYVFSADDGYVGVDLDDGLSEADRGAIMGTLDSYAEFSVSGKGVHIIVRASLNGHRRNRKGPFEVYEHGRYFCMSGAHVRGTPTTIEARQDELERVLERFLPAETEAVSPVVAALVDLDDRELLDRAMSARNGADFARLWNGDSQAYGSRSEADMALCSHLAFWTGNDAGRIDRLFRSSGLMREKWERADYRESTIQKSLAADVYRPSKVRPDRDAVGTHPGFRPAEGPTEEGASVRPYVVGDALRDAPFSSTPPSSPNPDAPGDAPVLQVVSAEVFAAVQEPSAEPLLGTKEETVLAAGGTVQFYGDGGAGKTTLCLDQAVHLAAGVDWLGLHVPHRVRVLWIENEGPRGKFREKLRAKLAAWDGPDPTGYLYVLEQPWSRFSFARREHQEELAALIHAREIAVMFAGPVARLGVEGGGTPKEIQAFVDLLEYQRSLLERPLAFELIHHENKQGHVSGAWEGATDTLAHVQARGNGHTAVVWRKVRWASELHGKTWKLDWRDGERYERDETPETADEDIAEQLLNLVRESPGGSWNAYEDKLGGRAGRKRTIRDELLEDGRVVNLGTTKGMRLYLPEQVNGSGQTSLEEPA